MGLPGYLLETRTRKDTQQGQVIHDQATSLLRTHPSRLGEENTALPADGLGGLRGFRRVNALCHLQGAAEVGGDAQQGVSLREG